MNKTLAAAALFFAAGSHVQASEPDLRFEQTISDCENKWFGAEAGDGRVTLGYVYIDPSAGFTFEHYGSLAGEGRELRAVPSEMAGEARVIHRIGGNFPAACLTQSQVTALGLPITPESMQFYKDDRPLGEHHTAWASHYNHIGASGKALDHIAKAIAAGASSDALTFEHAFALNALEEFEKSGLLLDPVVAAGSPTADITAELAYSRLRRGDIHGAIQLYLQALEPRQGEPSTRRWEFAQNIGAAYEHLGNAQQRDIWLRRAKQYRDEAK